jgi:hypothetical protein
MATMHECYVTAVPRPSDDMVMTFAKMFGSYIGEVLRLNHGGEWGMVTLDGAKFPGFRHTSGDLIWPWGRAKNRLVLGPEDNVFDYYRLLSRRWISRGSSI